MLEELKAGDPDLRTEVAILLDGKRLRARARRAGGSGHGKSSPAVYGEPVSYAAPSRYAVSSDAGPMFEYGIKGLTYGPGGVSAGGSFTVYDPSAAAK